ncbi:MAG: DUF2812 domain-containing protein [Lachnospiraceae bacterium]|nr:DUF2812 domain-containing protein [Lachnospiraceae bacterium]
MRKFRLYYDKEKEEAWLNEMCRQGWAMTKFFLGVFQFMPCEPGKYTYQVDMPGLPGTFGMHSGIKKEYIDFVEATGAEYVCSWGFWLIFRKETEQGDFKLYTDKESRIKLYRRIRFLFLAFALLELGLCIFNSYNVWDASGGFLASGSWSFWLDGGFLLAIVPVAACLAACSLFFMAARLTRKIRHLKQEKFFP